METLRQEATPSREPSSPTRLGPAEDGPAQKVCKCSPAAVNALKEGTNSGMRRDDLTAVLPDHDYRDCVADDIWDLRPLRSTQAGVVTTHFGKLQEPLVDFIRASPGVVGCVAWLTDLMVLEALSEVDTAIVVQKEESLRPVSGDNKKTKLQSKYEEITNDWERHWFPAPLGNLSFYSDPAIQGVRCAGNINTDKNPAFPRMHHKFLVRFEIDLGGAGLVPTAVWTGSFNFTKNGNNSLENAVVIEDGDVAAAYFNEFCRVAAISEPLDWESPYVAPEWRFSS